MSKRANVTLIPTEGADFQCPSYQISLWPAGIFSTNAFERTVPNWFIVTPLEFRQTNAMVLIWYDGNTCFIQANEGYTVNVNDESYGRNYKINIKNGDKIQITDCWNAKNEEFLLKAYIFYGEDPMNSESHDNRSKSPEKFKTCPASQKQIPTIQASPNIGLGLTSSKQTRDLENTTLNRIQINTENTQLKSYNHKRANAGLVKGMVRNIENCEPTRVEITKNKFSIMSSTSNGDIPYVTTNTPVDMDHSISEQGIERPENKSSLLSSATGGNDYNNDPTSNPLDMDYNIGDQGTNKRLLLSSTAYTTVSGNDMNTSSDNWEMDHNSTQQGTQIKGVSNMGMTCYANCIFQILAQTKLFLRTPIESDMDHKPLTYYLGRVLKDINQPGRENKYLTANRSSVKKVFDIIARNSSFSRYRQHDCSELLLYILQSLKTENDGNTGIFEMNLQTVISHRETKQYSSHVDICDNQLSFHLVVPLHQGKHKRNPTVAAGLNKMLKGIESFTGEELPCRFCDTINASKNRMFKLFVVSKAPEVLILQIGRTENVGFQTYSYVRKTNVLVEYDHSLRIAEVHWDENGRRKEEHYSYQLYGVVLHSGNIDCGHYYCYVKHQYSSEWFYCNDSWVTPIDQNMVLNSEDAYLLFYDKTTEER